MENRHETRIIGALTVALAVGCAQTPDGNVADTVYTNGRIYTVDETQPWAKAVAIQDSQFLAVGTPPISKRLLETARRSSTFHSS